MLKLCKQNKSKVKQQVKAKVLDGIVTSNSNLIDDIILSMAHEGIIDCLNNGFPDKRKHNTTIPFNLIMALSIAAKMKVMTSLTDIPYAIQDHRALAELGYNVWNSNPEDGWFTEGTLRHLLKKYESKDIFDYYNEIVQSRIFKLMKIKPDIHILDCTKIAVNFDNENYEGATISIDRKGEKMRGYKLASLRGLYGDSGVIEDVRFGTAATHDLNLSEDILRNTPCFNENDIVIMDRGFVSRDMINYLKTNRKVDVYIPIRKNMELYDFVVGVADATNDWEPHPTRKKQMICHVNNVGEFWRHSKDDVDLNSCVVWDEDQQDYYVFITTDLSLDAKDIILTYQLRPEIEEDFRQLKDFWKLEDFKSTKLNTISFHLVCVLFGYLFYQLYLNTEDGEMYIGKCLPVIMKKYKEKFLAYLVLYSGEYFCSMTLNEFMVFYDECTEDVKKFVLGFLK